MTRKDYELIAELINRQQEVQDAGYPAEESLVRLAHHFTARLEVDNPRFDRTKFLTACGF